MVHQISSLIAISRQFETVFS